MAVNLIRAENTEGRIDVAAALGSSEMQMFVYDLAPGASSSPYHYEFADEWMLVVAGSVVVRVPDGELELETGDVVRFPAGPDGAHKVMNRSDAPARTLMFSSARAPCVSVYPDSDTVGVFTSADPADDLVFVRSTSVPWSYGEDGWNRATEKS